MIHVGCSNLEVPRLRCIWICPLYETVVSVSAFNCGNSCLIFDSPAASCNAAPPLFINYVCAYTQLLDIPASQRIDMDAARAAGAQPSDGTNPKSSRSGARDACTAHISACLRTCCAQNCMRWSGFPCLTGPNAKDFSNVLAKDRHAVPPPLASCLPVAKRARWVPPLPASCHLATVTLKEASLAQHGTAHRIWGMRHGHLWTRGGGACKGIGPHGREVYGASAATTQGASLSESGLKTARVAEVSNMAQNAGFESRRAAGQRGHQQATGLAVAKTANGCFRCLEPLG